MTKVDPKKLVADNDELQDQICNKCGALIVRDYETNEPHCNCQSKEEEAAQIAAALQERKEKTSAQPAPRPVPENVAPIAEEPVDEPDPAEVAPQGEMPRFSAKIALQTLKGAPSPEQIDSFKQQWGKIYTLPFDVDEIYIWRYMNYREWQILQTNEGLVKDETKFQEQVVMRAVLWPKIGPVELNTCRAGLIQTLFGVIMRGSYFLNPDDAVMLVEELQALTRISVL